MLAGLAVIGALARRRIRRQPKPHPVVGVESFAVTAGGVAAPNAAGGASVCCQVRWQEPAGRSTSPDRGP
ncbi:MAG: hypothetical protein EHM59_11660 [Betaproteobacteria bacterium]|nr:MAG: hypothetical protein EHM59_11660 [Betaproteobacteria bacterium]